MRNPTGHRGFTLLEVVLAISLATGLMIAAIGFYQHIASVRDKISAETQLLISRRAIMQRMTDELRCAFGVDWAGLGITGQSDEIRFLTTSVPGRTVWLERSVLDTPPPPETDLKMVVYRLAIRTDEDDEEYIAGIERTCQKLIDARVSEEGENIHVVMITEQLRYLRFAYFDGAKWEPVWEPRQGLPLAIRITLGDEPVYEEEESTASEDSEAEAEEYEGRAFRRVVYLPASQLTLQRSMEDI